MQYDIDVLHEEEEVEKLLRSPTLRSTKLNHGLGEKSQGHRRRKNAKSKKSRSTGSKDEEGKLMYKMEEGGDSGSSSSRSSMEREFEHTTSRRTKILYITLITPSLGILFSLLLWGAYKASHTRTVAAPKPLLSNGTSNFAPTTILISLDGFRADFLNRGLTPTLNSFIDEGVSPQYMLPSFPSVTFPNHYTMVTGMYPESHGVVGNTFWDPELQEKFHNTVPSKSMQPKWWSEAEPLWVTAEKANVRSAIHMWPGSEVDMTLKPAFVDKYNGSEKLSRKVDRILQFLDLPSDQDPGIVTVTDTRPQFIASYVPNVDQDGHLYGPNSTEIRQTIRNVDTMLHDLFDGIKARNLTNIVNVVVVSDHGMATTSTDRLIQLEDLIDVSLIEHIEGWPLYGLRPKSATDLYALHKNLSAAAAQNENIDVYLRDENMPERYHFSNNKRIAPLWAIPKAGWAIVHKEDFDVREAKQKGLVYHPRGLHGYDHEHPLMRAIFVARGPAFPHLPGSRLEIFQNTEVYNIVCNSLLLACNPNNGTLHLPLRPIGLHSELPSRPDDVPTDFPPSTPSAIPSPVSIDPASPAALTPSTSSTATEMSKPHIGVDVPEIVPVRPTIDHSEGLSDGENGKDKESDRAKSWMQVFRDKFDAVKVWVDDVFRGRKHGEKEGKKEDDNGRRNDRESGLYVH